MLNFKDKKLLVCICYHYSADRVQYIKKVINNILSYPIDVSIIVDTNEENDSLNEFIHSDSPIKCPIYINVHNDLTHPYHLTWMHRLSIYKNLDNYDYFMYVEDDMLVPFENFVEYLINFEILFPRNCVPSFIRIEENDSKQFVTDITKEQKDVFVFKYENKVFANLTQPYHAFWIMPQKELKETLSEYFYMSSINREVASSYPMSQLNKIPFVLLNGDKVSSLSYSYHLANNYATDPDIDFGKMPLEELIITPLKQLTMEKVLEKYNYHKDTPSDINEHLPALYEYAMKCDHVTEMGTRSVVSAWAFVLANPKKLVCYDIERHQNIDELESLANEYFVNLKFIEADVLKTEIEETDLLFIDTFHTYEQLTRELELHSHKARKYLAFHDTTSFGFRDEADYHCVSDIVKNTEKRKTGLVPAIDEFMKSELGSCWEVEKIFMNNNGLTILRRK